MGRYKEPPWGFDCPYKHACPHLGTSATWANLLLSDLENDSYRDGHSWIEAQKEIKALEEDNLVLSARVAELESRLKHQHQLKFKPNRKASDSPGRNKPGGMIPRKRGAPLGHPPWQRSAPNRVDRSVDVPAPAVCPHCKRKELTSVDKEHIQIQEDIVLQPKTVVTQYRHQLAYCPNCRRDVFQTADGELRNCSIPPRFIAVDAVRVTAYPMPLEWLSKNSPLTMTDYAGTNEDPDKNTLGGIPNEPGGAGGFGGPPAGSSFTNLIDPFTIKDMTIDDGGAGAAGEITLKLISNVSDWTNNYVLTETEVDSDIYADTNDSLAVRMLPMQWHGDGKSSNVIYAMVSSMAFGARRVMPLYAIADTNIYESEHLELTLDMSALPTTSAVDTVTAQLTSSLLPGVISSNVLTETSADSEVFVSTNGGFSVSVKRRTGWGPGSKDEFSVWVHSDGLTLTNILVDAVETTTNSLLFETAALHNQGGPGTGPGAVSYLTFGALYSPYLLVDPDRTADKTSPDWFTGWSDTEEAEITRVRNGVVNGSFPKTTYFSKTYYGLKDVTDENGQVKEWRAHYAYHSGNIPVICFVVGDDGGSAFGDWPGAAGVLYLAKALGGDEFVAKAKDAQKHKPVDKVAVIKVDLKEVSFSGTDYRAVRLDDDSADYAPAHWQDNTVPLDGDADDAVASPPAVGQPVADRKCPVSYPRNKKAKVEAKFKVSPVPAGASIKVKGDGPGSLDISATTATIAGDTITLSATEMSGAFANAVDYLDPMTIAWKVSFDGGSSWCDAGSSANEVFVTLGEPNCRTRFRTVMYLACKTMGGTDASTCLANTWTSFKGLNVGAWDEVEKAYSKKLYYYNDIYEDALGFHAASAADLLVQQTGECMAWARLLQEGLLVNNVQSAVINVDPSLGYHFFGIKHIAFDDVDPEYPEDDPWKYSRMPFTQDLKDDVIPGIPGQNMQTPDAKIAFYRHYILLPVGSSSYYDPSYGITVTGEADFTTQAVDAWGKYNLIGTPDVYEHWRRRTSEPAKTVRFSPHP